MSQTPYGQQPPGPPQGPPPGWGKPPMSPTDERTWGAAAHWSSFAAGFLLGGLALVGPLVVMLWKGAESAYVRRQAVESLNFQLSMTIYALISAVLILGLIGFVLLPIVMILWLVFTLIGTIRSADGQEYRYPLTIRMVS